MMFANRNCPTCGLEADGTVESFAGRAFLDFDDAGHADYSGYTDVWWNEQRTNTNTAGEAELICPQGHSWFSPVDWEDEGTPEPRDPPGWEGGFASNH